MMLLGVQQAHYNNLQVLSSLTTKDCLPLLFYSSPASLFTTFYCSLEPTVAPAY